MEEELRRILKVAREALEDAKADKDTPVTALFDIAYLHGCINRLVKKNYGERVDETAPVG